MTHIFRLSNLILIAGLITLIPLSLLATSDHTVSNSVVTAQQLGDMPLAFTKNIGQWPDSVLFRADAGGATMWFTKDGIYYQYTRQITRDDNLVPDYLTAPRMGALDHPMDRHDIEPDSFEIMMIKAEFVGANADVEVLGFDELEQKCNYFIGNDPNEWHTDVPNYSGITMKDIYPGVDLVYRGNNGKFEYELSAESESRLEQVKVEYRGDDISQNQSSLIQTRFGELFCNSVLISNSNEQITKKLSSSTALSSSNVTLEYSTYLGGSGYDLGSSIAVDGYGSAYIFGYIESTDFPIFNPFQEIFQGGEYDLFVTKLSSSGNSLIYSTYLGGSGDDIGESIAVDSSGSAYVTGKTYSTDFPTLNPYQTNPGDGLSDVFVSKLSSSGSLLIYSTYLGGTSSDYGRSIVVDGAGSAYVTGSTNSTDFPTLNPYQTDQAGTDMFVSKLSSSGSSLIYSTYLGGTINDYGKSIAVDGAGSAYLTGQTNSTDFPTLNPYQTYQASWDVFVTKLSSSGSFLIYSTYLGGSNSDEVYSIAIDESGSAYLTGKTYSTDFPTLNPYQTYQASWDIFVTKLSSSGSLLIYSTFLGGSGGDVGYSIAVDGSGSAYLTGFTNSSDFPMLNPYQTFQGGSDLFVSKLSSSGSLLYSTYLGGSDVDAGYGIAVDEFGSAYLTGYTYSIDFPTLNPYQTNQDGYVIDLFVTKFSPPSCCGLYTGGFRGNTNCDDTGLRDLADITRLIDNVYISKIELCCPMNGNVNGDAGGLINLADITKLIDHVYISKEETAVCE